MTKSGIQNIAHFHTLYENYKPRSTHLIKSGAAWHEQLTEESQLYEDIGKDVISNLKELAQRILANDVQCYECGKSKWSSYSKLLMSHGTVNDKLATYMLKCIESPAHCMNHLLSSIKTVTNKANRNLIKTFESLHELFTSTLIPHERLLRKFENHNFGCLLPLVNTHREQVEKQLALWLYENELLSAYIYLIEQLSHISKDALESTRTNAVKCLLRLLDSYPHQESEKIIYVIVNKFGDPSRHVATYVMYELRSVLFKNQSLRLPTIAFIQEMLHRPNLNKKAKYNCLCFMKDILFKKEEYELVGKVIGIYFAFFKACIKTGEVDSKLMAAILRGLNRAIPYADLRNKSFMQQLDSLYKMTHFLSFGSATQALHLIYNISQATKDSNTDRFYRLLYHNLNRPEIGTSPSAAFLNLVFKAMQDDECVPRIKAFIKRLLQVAHHQDPHVICAILFTISEALKGHIKLKLVQESFISSKLKSDIDCDEEDEYYSDVDIEEVKDSSQNESSSVSDNRNQELCENVEEEKDGKKPDTQKPSWLHRSNFCSDVKYQKHLHYTPLARNPVYCGAEYAVFWELDKFMAHYHPSVSIFAKKLLNGEPITYSGNPLIDFSLISFLDRFAYRNPKKPDTVSDKAKLFETLGSKILYQPSGTRGIPVNMSEFYTVSEKNIAKDDLHFYRFFSKYMPSNSKDDEHGDVDDDEVDKFLEKFSGEAKLEDFDNLDFSSSISKSKKGGKSKKKKNVDDELDEEDEEEYDNEEEEDRALLDGMADNSELDEDNDELESLGSLGSEVEEGEFDFDNEEEFDADSSDGEYVQAQKSKKRSKLQSKPGKRFKDNKYDNILADAEDFAHLLEADNDEYTGTLEAISNKDKSSKKQLEWERKQTQFMKNKKGKKWKNEKSFKSKKSRGKPKFNNKNKFKR